MPTFLRKAPNIYEFEGVRFYPGMNQVSEETFKAMQAKESYKKHFSLQLQGHDPAMVMIKSSGEVEKEARDLKQLILKSQPQKAIEIIKETLLLQPLAEALEEEKRKPVIEALEKQIAEIKRKPTSEELLGGVKNSVPPPTGNLMDSLNIAHEFKDQDKY